MINVLIYLETKNEAIVLIDELLRLKLIANAAIDIDNVSYKVENGKIIEHIHSVITAQTKSLLFSQITKHIQEKYSSMVPVYSIPIIQANDFFDNLIRNTTIKT